MSFMTEADIDICLDNADKLRADLNLSPKSPAIATIQKWMLAAFSEGFRRGFWARDEDDELQGISNET